MLPSIDPTTTVIRLRTEIRDLEARSRALRAEIASLRGPATGPARHALWLQKQALGRDTRAALLALAFVRGRAYRSTEPIARTEPHWRAIAARLLGCETWPKDDRGNLIHAQWMSVLTTARDVERWCKGAPEAAPAPAEAAAP